MSKKKTQETEGTETQKVKMRFQQDMFYNNQDKPYFERGKVYEVEGADQIQRWVKRGGEIVEGELTSEKGEVLAATGEASGPEPIENHEADISEQLAAADAEEYEDAEEEHEEHDEKTGEKKKVKKTVRRKKSKR